MVRKPFQSPSKTKPKSLSTVWCINPCGSCEFTPGSSLDRQFRSKIYSHRKLAKRPPASPTFAKSMDLIQIRVITQATICGGGEGCLQVLGSALDFHFYAALAKLLLALAPFLDGIIISIVVILIHHHHHQHHAHHDHHYHHHHYHHCHRHHHHHHHRHSTLLLRLHSQRQSCRCRHRLLTSSPILFSCPVP